MDDLSRMKPIWRKIKELTFQLPQISFKNKKTDKITWYNADINCMFCLKAKVMYLEDKS